MDIDTFLKSVGPIAGLLGVIFTALIGLATWYGNRCTQKSQLSKNELEIIQSAISVFAGDGELSGFLRDVQKEKLCQLMFGRQIPIGEIGRLMDYYRKGFATTSEICEAWEHRNDNPNVLSFCLGWGDRAIVFGFFIYCLCCFIGGLLAFICAYITAFFGHSYSLAAQFLGISIILFTAAWGTLRSNRSLFTATRLAKREKRFL